MAVLLLLSRRFQWAGGRVFWAYVAIYSTGRAWIDAIRSEPVLMVGPMRIHTLVALVMALVGVLVFVLLTIRQAAAWGRGGRGGRLLRAAPHRPVATTPR